MSSVEKLVDPPDSFYNTFSRASTALQGNQTILLLDRNPGMVTKIRDALKDMGQTHFSRLSLTKDQSRIALAMYAGDGIVTKIIPTNYMMQPKNVIYHLPAITSQVIKGEECEFAINTYPWVSPSDVTQEQVDLFRKKINEFGMDFNEGDGKPKNVHRMPDRKKTFVGIDSDMYQAMKDGLQIPDNVLEEWNRYVHALFPIYESGGIPPQTEDTDFSLISIHDKSKEASPFSPVTLENGAGLVFEASDTTGLCLDI